MKLIKGLFFILPLLFIFEAQGRIDLMVEGGAQWQSLNDVRIPPASGTFFEIDNLDSGPFLHYRLESYFRLSNKHALRLVFAPSVSKATGRPANNVNYNGQNFSNTQDLTVRYQFNSYRLSYVYGFWGFGDDQINIGVTGKVRDARITFSQGGVSSSYENLGFVPLLYFEYQESLGALWKLNFTVDAAAAPQGRAVDGAIKVRRQFGESSHLGLGFRSLEGGAGNDKVYTFSWFNYAILDFYTSF